MTAIDPTRTRTRVDEDTAPEATTQPPKKAVHEELPRNGGPMVPADVVQRLLERNAIRELVKSDTIVTRPVLVVDGMSPSDVVQAINVADCTVEATLASLARTEKGRAWLQSRITTVLDAQGEVDHYVVLLKATGANGKMEDLPISVDPHRFVKGHPGSSTTTKEVWPLVYEAAIAKAVHGTANLEQLGYMPFTSSIITGKPAVDTVPSTDPKFGDAIVDDFMAGRVQTLNTAALSKDNPLGLAPSHAYTVVDVRPRQPVLQPDGSTKLETLVVVRNPWGHSDPRPMTIAEVRAEFGTYSVGDVP